MRQRPFCAARPAVRLRRAHLVGIAGSGMRALAEYLRDAGWVVSGSDSGASTRALRRLASVGISARPRHAADHVRSDTDLLVYSPAVGEENAERRAARELGIEELSYPQMLGRLTQNHPALVVTGTHGKSTTCAMVASILQAAGCDPSVVMGAERQPDSRSGWKGDGRWLVVEGCEYREAFLNLEPQVAVVLNVDLDHVDCFSDRAAVEAAFRRFVERVPEDGWLVAPCTTPLRDVLRAATSAQVQTFSPRVGSPPTEDSRAWWAADVRCGREGVRFRLFCGESFVTDVFCGLWGRHNVINAVAAAAVAASVGARGVDIREGLAAFEGIKRRLELVGYWRGVTLIDDYAHHPAEVCATLSAVRQRFGRRRVWVGFQPHQIGRAQRWVREFAAALRGVHHVFVVPAFPARECGPDVAQQAASVSRRLVAALRAEGQSCGFEPSLDRLVATLDDALQVGDVLVTMGAGDITKVPYEFVGRLSRNRAAG